MASRMHAYRQAIADTIKAAMPHLATCEALSSKFDLGELTKRSIRAPAVFVVLLRSPLRRAAAGGLDADANVAVFCVADGPEGRREEQAFVLAEAVARLAGVKQLWSLTRVGAVEEMDFEQVHADTLDRKGVSCVVLTFRQRVSGVAEGLFDDEDHVPVDLYVNGVKVDHA